VGRKLQVIRFREMPSAARHRALELLAASSEGCAESSLAENGVPYALIFNLIREGLAVAKTEGVRPMQVTRIKITDAGRAALERRDETLWPGSLPGGPSGGATSL
jgi:hypothetical protein